MLVVREGSSPSLHCCHGRDGRRRRRRRRRRPDIEFRPTATRLVVSPSLLSFARSFVHSFVRSFVGNGRRTFSRFVSCLLL